MATADGQQNVRCPEKQGIKRVRKHWTSLSTFGVAAINHCLQSSGEWVSIDEIGFLEESCEPYKSAIRDLFDRKRVACVIRKQDLPFLNELRCRPDVFVVDLDLPFTNAGCVIMASGLGKRFGSNKLMTDFLGKPLISHILDTTEHLFSKRVVVTRHKSVADLCHRQEIPALLHDLPYRSDTVRLGLEALGDAERVMFCPGDQPLLSKNTVAALLLCSANDENSIWRPCHENTPGSPVLFPAWAFAELQNLPHGKGGGYIAKKYPESCRMLEIPDPHELADADTPESLEALRQYAVKEKR